MTKVVVEITFIDGTVTFITATQDQAVEFIVQLNSTLESFHHLPRFSVRKSEVRAVEIVDKQSKEKQ